MAKTIPQLTDATTVNAADELIIQQGGITKRATGAELAKGLNAINGTVNVKDFGAVGDGVADDTAALQAALASNAGVVRFPKGSYRITQRIDVSGSGQTLEGASNRSTIILAEHADGGFRFLQPHQTLRDMRIICNNNSGSSAGIELHQTTFTAVNIETDWNGTGRFVNGARVASGASPWVHYYEKCTFTTTSGDAFLVSSGAASFNNAAFISCRFVSSLANGFNLQGVASHGITFVNCLAENNALDGFRIAGRRGNHVSFHGVYLEHNDGSGILLGEEAPAWSERSVSGISFSGNTATATSTSHGFSVDEFVTISGATGPDAGLYNGVFKITGAATNTFTYTMAGTPAGNATGTIVANTQYMESCFIGGLTSWENGDAAIQVAKCIGATISGASVGANDSGYYTLGAFRTAWGNYPATSAGPQIAIHGFNRRGAADDYNMTVGSNPILLTPLMGSATYDPPSLSDGTGVTTTLTVTGAALGDYVEPSFSNNLQGIVLSAWVSAADTVSVRFQNETGSAILEGTATYDPPSLNDGDGATTTVTVTGAALGDFVETSFSLDLQGITTTAWVSAANTVSVRLQNETGGTIDLGSGTLRARVRPAAGSTIDLGSGTLRARVFKP
jgi:hypothetical protein